MTGKISKEILEQEVAKAGGVNIICIPQPNFLGLLEDASTITDWAHDKGALVVGVVSPMAMALLVPPGQWGQKGADIACGEGQPLGVPLAGGGPYFGFMTCKRRLMRQLPGRIVGRTQDNKGVEAYTLTLQAREQHIRRAKATSNICTNQGLLVTAATIYMSLLGAKGLKQVARKCSEQLISFKQQVTTIANVAIKFSGKQFHECIIELPVPAKLVIDAMAEQGVLAGYDLGQAYPEFKHCLLVCLTETKIQDDIAQYCECLSVCLEALRAPSKQQDKAPELV